MVPQRAGWMQLKERVCRREMEGGHWSLKLDFLLPLPALALWNRLSSFAGWCVVSADSPQCGEHDCDEPTSNWSFSRELLSCQATRKGCKQRPASFDFFFFNFNQTKLWSVECLRRGQDDGDGIRMITSLDLPENGRVGMLNGRLRSRKLRESPLFDSCQTSRLTPNTFLGIVNEPGTLVRLVFLISPTKSHRTKRKSINRLMAWVDVCASEAVPLFIIPSKIEVLTKLKVCVLAVIVK